MAHRTGVRAQTAGLGGATTFEGGIYATYASRALAHDAVQPVDLPGFFAPLQVTDFPCHPLTHPPGSYTNLAVRRSPTQIVFAALPASSKPCPRGAWEWCSPRV